MNIQASQPRSGATSAVGQRVLKNTAVLSIGRLTTLASMTIWTAIVARQIGPETYGIYSYAQATLGILAIFVNLGLDRLVARDVAQRPEDGLTYFNTFLLLKCGISAVLLGGFLVFTYLSGWQTGVVVIFTIVTVNLFVSTLYSLANSILHAHQVMQYVVIGQAINSILTLITAIIAVFLHQSFTVILLLSFSATCVQLVLAFWFVSRFYPLSVFGIRSHLLPASEVVRLMKVGWPFALDALIALLYSNMVILLLRQLSSDPKSLGYFSAAQRIQSMTMIVPEMLLWAIFPAFASMYAVSRERFVAMFERAFKYLFLVSIPIAIGLFVVAPDVLQMIFGAKYAPAGNTLRILALLQLGAIGYVVGPAFSAMNRQWVDTVVDGTTTVLAGVVCYLVIPRYGTEGAAGALVLLLMVSRTICAALLFRWLDLRFPTTWVVKTVVASVGMGWIALLLVQQVNFLIVSFLLGPAIYLAAHLALGTLDLSDWNHAQRLLTSVVRRNAAPSTE